MGSERETEHLQLEFNPFVNQLAEALSLPEGHLEQLAQLVRRAVATIFNLAENTANVEKIKFQFLRPSTLRHSEVEVNMNETVRQKLIFSSTQAMRYQSSPPQKNQNSNSVKKLTAEEQAEQRANALKNIAEHMRRVFLVTVRPGSSSLDWNGAPRMKKIAKRLAQLTLNIPLEDLTTDTQSNLASA